MPVSGALGSLRQPRLHSEFTDCLCYRARPCLKIKCWRPLFAHLKFMRVKQQEVKTEVNICYKENFKSVITAYILVYPFARCVVLF